MPDFVAMADRMLIRLLDGLVIGLAGLLLCMLNYAVFARFVLNESVSWGEELPSHILAMLAFIGAAYLTRTNEHIGFDGVLRLFATGIQRWLLVFNWTLMACFAAALAWYGGVAAWSFAGRMLISVDVPMSLFRGAMAVSATIICAICIVRVIGLVSGRLHPDALLPRNDG